MGGTFIAPTVEGKKEWHLLAQWNPLVAHCLICIDKQLQHNDILNAKMDGIHECEFGVFYIYPYLHIYVYTQDTYLEFGASCQYVHDPNDTRIQDPVKA